MFEPWSTSHLVVLGIFAAGVVVLLAIGPLVRGRPVERPLAIALAAGNIVFGLIGTVTEFSDGDIKGNLPLQLCDFAWIPVAWALLTRHPLALALTYYWGLTLALQALVQPTLDEAFPDPNFFAFWGKHVLLVWGAVYATLTLRQGPDWRVVPLGGAARRRSGWRSRCRVNGLLDTNYGYFNEQARRHGARLPRPLALVRAGRGRDRRRDLGPAHPPLDAETGVACCTFGVGDGHMVGSGSARVFAWFVFLVAFALLPFAPCRRLAAPANADPPVFDGKEIKDLCTISASGQSCPVFPPPAGLLNPGAVAAAGPEGAAALRRLEDKAIANTLADHQLPASDHDAAMTWAREDSQLALWGLIAEAIETPAGERTADQQLAVDWMTQLDSAQPQDAALQAGAEYATWAGLDVNQYWRMARTATETELTTFLAQDIRTLRPSATPREAATAATPHPRRTPVTDYDGSLSPNCFSACTSILGCPIPTPTYDDFVDWGKTVSLAGATNDALTAQAINIGLAAGFAAVAVGTALAVGLSSAIVAAIGASIWVFAFGAAAVTSAAAAASIAATAAAVAAGATAAGGSGGGRGRLRVGLGQLRPGDRRQRCRGRRDRGCGPGGHPGHRDRGARGDPRVRQCRAARQDRPARRRQPRRKDRSRHLDGHDGRTEDPLLPVRRGDDADPAQRSRRATTR